MEAFLNWVSTYGSIIGFFVQILYFVVISVAAIWAVLLFKRLVDFKTGAGEADESVAEVSTDEFVD